ncbi:MAG: hypothetical protein K0Q72_1135, partial [Armatimonadetes bacterium]|nr:hypothetical protein [Armatimonadota bacterium]
MKVSLRHSLATFVLVAISATAANAVSPGLEKAVAAARQEATRKAAARNWDGAVEAIRNARDRVRSERRTALRPQSPAETPAYRAAKKNLHEWLLQQQKLVKAGKTDRQRVGREFKQKELALQKTYGWGALPPHDSTAAGRATAAY